MNIIKNLFGKAAFAALLTTGLLGALATPAAAHETDCPYCKLKVVQDTKEMDNEVLLRYGNKRIEYRCVMCGRACRSIRCSEGCSSSQAACRAAP